MIIGLTGGIASGKTAIAKLFQDLGATIVDLDSLSHYLLKNDKLINEKLVYGFGCGILNDRGEIDRSKLGRLVFDNPDYLNFLNNIIHPRVIQLSGEIIQQELANDSSKIIVMDVPLLIECNMTDKVDLVVLVYADEETQIQRLLSRGLSESDAIKRIRSQMPFKEKQPFADYIIDNNDSFDDVTKQVKEIWNLIEKKA
ncbi:MAG: dephospho-CoA kinase [Candidatus Poribacteria bacterium]